MSSSAFLSYTRAVGGAPRVEDAAGLRHWAWQKREFSRSYDHVALLSASGASIRDDYASFLVESADPITLRRTIEALSTDVAALLWVLRSAEGARVFREQISAIEGVLVACMGHYAAKPRAHAVRLLNALYDCSEWQLDGGPFEGSVSSVGDDFSIDVFTLCAPSEGEDLRILVAAPSPLPLTTGPPGGDGDAPLVLHTVHAPSATTETEVWVRVGGGGTHAYAPRSAAADAATDSSIPAFARVRVTRVRALLPRFARCGFYDWRVVIIGRDGAPRPLPAVQPLSPHDIAVAVSSGALPSSALLNSGTSTSTTTAALSTPVAMATEGDVTAAAAAAAASASSPLVAQGRYIVHRAGLRSEQWHQAVVDLGGMKCREETGEIIRHGTFADVASSLEGELRDVQTLYLFGALERDNGWGEREPEVSSVTSASPSNALQPYVDSQQSAVFAQQYVPFVATPSAATADGSRGNGSSSGGGGGGGAPTLGTSRGLASSASFSDFLDRDELRVLSREHVNGPAAVPAPSVDQSVTAVAFPPAGVRAHAMRPDANPHAVVDRLTPNRMLGGEAGFRGLLERARARGTRILVQCDAAISASRPHRKYKGLYAHTLDVRGQAVVHAGSDSLENQWEDTQLLNYRKVEAWDMLVSEACTLVTTYGLGGLYLPDCQSYPFIMASDTGELFRRDVDGENHYTPREILEGEVVIANAEVGYWAARAVARTFPNPLLVKLTRALWRVCPDAVVVGECHWGRAGSIARSGIVPHSMDVVSAIATTIGRSVDKLGNVSSVSLPPNVGPVDLLRALLATEADGLLPPQAAPHFRTYSKTHAFPAPLANLLRGPGGRLPRGAQLLQLRSLSSPRMPYPALLLGRSAWTGVDLSYTLPGIPAPFQDEVAGTAYRVDVTGTYQHNDAYLAEERRKREKRVAAERHNLRSRDKRGGSGSGSGGGAGAPLHPPVTTAATAAAVTTMPAGDAFVVGDGEAFDHAWNSTYSGHLGAGGSMPSRSRAPPAPAGVPSGMPSRGFSHLNLQELTAWQSGIATGSAKNSPLNTDNAVTAATTTVPLTLPTYAPVPSAMSSFSTHGGGADQGWLTAETVANPPRRLPNASSSPALANMLLMEPFRGGGGGGSDSVGTSTRSGGGGGGSSGGSPVDIGRSLFVDTGRDDDDDDDDDEEEEEVEGELRVATVAALSGSSTEAGSFRAGPITPSSGPRLSIVARSPVRHSMLGRGPASPNMRKALSGRPLGAEVPDVQSWQASDSYRVMGSEALSGLRDGIKSMGTLEARLRCEVGPEYGFDLSHIALHYAHRAACRMRYPVLRDGALVVLAARHRFGEHGHVFAFARYLPGFQVAIISCNFNGHPSTFAVDASPLAASFGATTAADACESVAQLMTASLALGFTVRARLGGASEGAAHPSATQAVTIEMPLPSLNLRGGVWEVRNVFESLLRPDEEHSSASGGVSNKKRGKHTPYSTALSNADGPLVAILAADEAAYAPVMTTLQPHRSFAWVCSPASAAATVGGGASEMPASPSAASEADPLDRGAEVAPAAMQWLFASSLLRLQAMLRLKEVGRSSAVITYADLDAAGGNYETLLLARDGAPGGGARAPEAWISPGEMLKDEEVQTAVRHNLVYSLLRHVAERSLTAFTAARTAAASAVVPGNNSPVASSPLDAVVGVVAELLEAALRVLVTHFRLREGPPDPNMTRRGPNLVRAEPLPPLHGAMRAMRRGGSDAGAATSSTPSPPSVATPDASDLSGWFCIDGEVAATLVRAALFLAVKDVVLTAAKATAAAASKEAPVGSTDVSDEDAALSALLVRALVRVSRGHSPGSAAVQAAPGSPIAHLQSIERCIAAFARRLVWRNALGPIVLCTPELGKWSTVGGLGVMVDELSVGLAELGAEVVCISPYYHLNRKGESNYLAADGIAYTGRSVTVWVSGERIEVGVHEGFVKGVRVMFLHNALAFPRPYPPNDAFHELRSMSAFARAALETLCQWHLIPSLIITNDWFTGLVPAYSRNPRFFGSAFARTDFMHICHNLDADYEGRLWPSRAQGTLSDVHELDRHLLVDPYWADIVINPTRAALLCSDTWATVSRSYRLDLLASSPLKALLKLGPHPFAHPNGIPVSARLTRLSKLPTSNHGDAKAALQRKYFGCDYDPSTPLFAFVGRITLQKGVHLILLAVEAILREFDYKVQILVGGMASEADNYGRYCSGLMHDLRSRYSKHFWANPTLFFTDGDLVNMGADFCLMPSLFEPGGIVQQEFFVAGTPVIAFKTGGLKDTVHDFNPTSTGDAGNGLTFDTHSPGELIGAVRRAMSIYRDASGAYERLRSNARASVIDLSVVSLAWYREFHRLRRCLPPAPHRPMDRVPVTFTLHSSDVVGCTPTTRVAVAGSFNGWQPTLTLAPIPDFSSSDTRFEASTSLPPGLYTFKFVLDGTTWVTNPQLPLQNDAQGNANNSMLVTPPLGGMAGDA